MEAKNLTRRQIQELIVEYTAAISKYEFQIATAKDTIAELENNLDGAPITIGASTRTAAKPSTAKRSPGRPKKTATKKAAETTAAKPKKRRGRPPKAKSTSTSTATKTTTAKKRGPGRPKKATPSAASTTKKPTTANKRGPGRPKKATSSAASTAKTATTAKKRGPGRPKKATPKANTQAKKESSVVKELESKTSGYRLSDWDTFVIESLNKKNHILTKNELSSLAESWAKSKKMGMDSKQVYTKISNVLHKLTNKKNLLARFSNDAIKNAYGIADWYTPTGNLKDDFLPKK